MTIFQLDITRFQLDITRFPDVIAYFVRWKRRYAPTALDDLSDQTLQDIGLPPSGRDLDAVKPFWMP
jgi:uncharacterized protein YjiS (DUF1127 family)